MEISVDIKFGTVRILPDPSDPRYSIKEVRYIDGEVTRERFYSHYICWGFDECAVCGKILREKRLTLLLKIASFFS